MSDYQEAAYLRTIARLREIQERCPLVDDGFLLTVASMPQEELQRRILIQYDWLRHFSRCLDGLDFGKVMGKTSVPVESCASADNIRELVQYLLSNL